MNLSTNYMGLELKSPIIIGSSNLSLHTDNSKRYADAGAGAIVLKSLFEEQIVADRQKLLNQEDMYFWYPEAMNFIDDASKEHGVDNYLKLIEDTKKAVSIPVIASINCVSAKEWPAFASKIKDAGADAIELNIGIPANELNVSANTISETYIEILKSVKREVDLPISVKMGYHFNNIVRMSFKLKSNGADALVLFNRYYRPDIDINNLTITKDSVYSSENEITIALRWLALIHHQFDCDLAASTGIHSYEGVVKSILTGAKAAQLCSTIYKHGAPVVSTIISELQNWMREHNFSNIEDFRGKLAKEPEYKKSFERLQFMRKSVGDIA
jgi:dihydroorotate dehydrogenase (fumarate)